MMYGGEFAALSAAVCWSFTAMFFTSAGIRIGSFSVNVIRLTLALPVLAGAALLLFGTTVQDWYTGGNIWLLALSGLIGLTLGDAALFHAFTMIGPRKTTLIFSGTPIVTALISVPYLGETLSPTAWLAIFITVGGVAWVVAERSPGRFEVNRRNAVTGSLLAFLGATGQAVGLIFSKAGMAGVVDPLAATLFRMIAATAVIWVYVILIGQSRKIVRSVGNLDAMKFVAGGAFFGPVLGVWLSIVAVRYAEAGVAATLMATVPIMILPGVRLIYKERISPRAVFGAIIAVAGIALLFNR